MSEISPASRHIAVIGGGIAGLAAAHHLVEIDPTCRVTLLEAGPRLGGVISTLHEDGFQVEQSSDNFITTVPWGLDLCKRLGLTDQLIQTNPACRRTFVVRAGRLCRLPDGFLMMAPTRMWPLAVTPILSPLGKLRAALEYFIPPRSDDADESMAHFVRRRLGREVFERLVEPLVSAVYAADMEKLSVLATLPRFREMERDFGSLIRAMRHQMKNRPKSRSESGARYSMFVTLRDGLCSLIEAIASRLPQGTVRLNMRAVRIERRGDGWRVWGAEVRGCEKMGTGSEPSGSNCGRRASREVPVPIFSQPLRDQRAEVGGQGSFALDCDALIVATPSYVTAELLRPVDSDVAADLAGIGHSGTAILSVGYQAEQIDRPLDGMGAVVPAAEHSPILAISFSSVKYAHRAPEGKVLLRVFVGGARRPELCEMEDGKLRSLVLSELAQLLAIRGEPCYANVARWPGTMPQYHVGHKELVARIESRVAKLANLQLAGNAYHGVGIPDCIHGGELAAERIVRTDPQ